MANNSLRQQFSCFFFTIAQRGRSCLILCKPEYVISCPLKAVFFHELINLIIVQRVQARTRKTNYLRNVFGSLNTHLDPPPRLNLYRQYYLARDSASDISDSSCLILRYLLVSLVGEFKVFFIGELIGLLKIFVESYPILFSNG